MTAPPVPTVPAWETASSGFDGFLSAAGSCRPGPVITGLISPSPLGADVRTGMCEMLRRDKLCTTEQQRFGADSGAVCAWTAGQRAVDVFGVEGALRSLSWRGTVPPGPQDASVNPASRVGANSALRLVACLDRRLIIKTVRDRDSAGVSARLRCLGPATGLVPTLPVPPAVGRWQQRRRRGNAAPSPGFWRLWH